MSKDKEHYLMINDKYEDGRTGSGTKLPLKVDIPMKRYARVPYWIGKDSEDIHFKGDIAEIRMENDRGKTVLHYDFSDVGGGVVEDLSENDNHGIIYGNMTTQTDTIDKLYDLPIPHRRYGRYKCLKHEDLGIVGGKFNRGETTAENERIYRTEMQEKKLDYKSIGLNSSKYKIDSIDKNLDKNLEMINIKTFYDN
jgi:hypothetical protein